MADQFKSKTLREDNCLPFETTDFKPDTSKDIPVPKPKAFQPPKVREKKANRERPIKRPKDVAPDDDVALGKFGGEIDLNKLVSPVPEHKNAFDALMADRRKEQSRGGRGKARRSGRRNPRRPSPEPSLSSLAQELLLNDNVRTTGQPPPFRGI